MFKRLRWMTFGGVIGFASAFYAVRRLKSVKPNAVREAIAEGRAAMREREAELRGQLKARR